MKFSALPPTLKNCYRSGRSCGSGGSLIGVRLLLQSCFLKIEICVSEGGPSTFTEMILSSFRGDNSRLFCVCVSSGWLMLTCDERWVRWYLLSVISGCCYCWVKDNFFLIWSKGWFDLLWLEKVVKICCWAGLSSQSSSESLYFSLSWHWILFWIPVPATRSWVLNCVCPLERVWSGAVVVQLGLLATSTVGSFWSYS